MTNPLVVTPHDVAQCLQVCDSTFRCFATVSRPLALPFSRVAGQHKKPIRAYHLAPVLDWIKSAAPERATPEFEAALFSRAVQNQERFQ